MRTTKIKLVVLAVCCLSLLGGAAAGMLATRFSRTAHGRVTNAHLPLAEQLQLTPDQRVQIQQIWEAVRQQGDESYRQAQALDQHRQDELIKLLTKEQLEQYQKIYSDYQDRYTRVTAQREAAFQQAIDRTKELLTETQREKYDAILSSRKGSKANDGSEMLRPAAPAPPTTKPATDFIPPV
jgi:uncharacterized membrane protein